MRTILVTGHSKGIGLAITETLLQKGHSVIGVSRSAIEERDNLYQYSIDLSDLDKASTLAATLKSTRPDSETQLCKPEYLANHLESLDGVICNAGSGQFGALENFSAKQIEQSIRLNLVSPLVITRELLPKLKTQKRSDIVFIGSESSIQAGRFGSVYSAAKFGIRGAAQALRAECASVNCHVGVVNPGMVRTDFFNNLSFEPGAADQHALQAQNVADAVLSMLNSSDNAVIEEINLRPLQHVVQKKRN